MKTHNNSAMKLKSFTINEIMVVLIIIGILVFLSLPALMPLITKAKTTEAKLQLKHLHTLQETYFYQYSKYSDDLKIIGFQQAKLTTEEGDANYLLEIATSSDNGFIGRATSVVDFDKDGVFNVWEINQDKKLTEVIPD